jgi:hypothetical protein
MFKLLNGLISDMRFCYGCLCRMFGCFKRKLAHLHIAITWISKKWMWLSRSGGESTSIPHIQSSKYVLPYKKKYPRKSRDGHEYNTYDKNKVIQGVTGGMCQTSGGCSLC